MMAATGPRRRSASPLLLGADEVHVWQVDLDPQASIPELTRLLSADEETRAGRFVFARDQRRFAVSHGALRSILARYLSADPSMLQFTQAPHQKPRLVGTSDISFNLSHSGEQAVIGVARAREVGIDIEQVRDLDDLEALAASCFAAAELASWRGLPEVVRKSTFFATWTRKEAYLKAGGAGLSRSLKSFEVSVGPGERPCLLADTLDPTAAARWTFFDLDAGPGYAATLAVAGPARVTCRSFMAEEEHGSRRGRVAGALQRGGEPGAAVLHLARRQGAAEGMERCWQDRVARGVPDAYQGGLDGHAAGEPAREAEGAADVRLARVGGRT